MEQQMQIMDLKNGIKIVGQKRRNRVRIKVEEKTWDQCYKTFFSIIEQHVLDTNVVKQLS